ncbi:MAG: hypothetical protein MI919_03970, partial [Holophagales bacterium]|nr:hypothetical protein [Holophagales bacterium]
MGETWFWADKSTLIDALPHKKEDADCRMQGQSCVDETLRFTGPFPGCPQEWHFDYPLTIDGKRPPCLSDACPDNLMIQVRDRGTIQYIDKEGAIIPQYDPDEEEDAPEEEEEGEKDWCKRFPDLCEYSFEDVCGTWLFEKLCELTQEAERPLSFAHDLTAVASSKIFYSRTLVFTTDEPDLEAIGESLRAAQDRLDLAADALQETRTRQADVLARYRERAEGPLTTYSAARSTISLKAGSSA